jgi:serine/threonine-protein kinase HipA
MAFPDLAVWMNGLRVGNWFWTRTGTPGLRYDDAWVDSPQSRPLSLSLPVPAAGGDVTGPKVENYFDNLLPDSVRIRERMRRRFGAASVRAADLLAAIGRDCVGAVQLVRDGDAPAPHDRIESTALTDAQVEHLLAHVQDVDGGSGDDLLADFRISIAGAQEKTALLRLGDRWHLPHGGTPTTHIFKLPLGLVGNMRADMTSSVENEWLCHALLRELGFAVAPTEMAEFGRQKVLVVERFDRRWVDGAWIARLPQEDFCQATGTPADFKYQNEGGPGIRSCLDLLSGGNNAQADCLAFALAQLAFWLLAATDGHAKNFSIHLERGGGFRLTPMYDVLSAWPIIGNGPNQLSPRRAKLSMALRGNNQHYHLHEIRTRHFEALALQTGVPDAFDRMVGLVLSVNYALERVEALLPPNFPRAVFNSIRRGMTAQAALFVNEL